MRKRLSLSLPLVLVAGLMLAGCGSSSSDDSEGGALPTAAQMQTWPAAWCKAQVGMTRDQLRSLMGPQTAEVTLSRATAMKVEPQMAWQDDVTGWQLTAQFDGDDRVKELQTNGGHADCKKVRG